MFSRLSAVLVYICYICYTRFLKWYVVDDIPSLPTTFSLFTGAEKDHPLPPALPPREGGLFHRAESPRGKVKEKHLRLSAGSLCPTSRRQGQSVRYPSRGDLTKKPSEPREHMLPSSLDCVTTRHAHNRPQCSAPRRVSPPALSAIWRTRRTVTLCRAGGSA